MITQVCEKTKNFEMKLLKKHLRKISMKIYKFEAQNLSFPKTCFLDLFSKLYKFSLSKIFSKTC